MNSCRNAGVFCLRFECYPIAWKPKLRVTRHVFAPNALCHCRPGFYGAGSNCQQCPSNTYADEANMSQCTPCPTGATTTKGGRYSIDYCHCPPGQVITKGKSERFGKCACKKDSEFSEKAQKCMQCGKNMKKIDERCACWPRYYYNKSRGLCDECNPSAGFECPGYNTKTSNWLVQPGWWHSDEFTELPRECGRAGICVYNAAFAEGATGGWEKAPFFRLRLTGDFKGVRLKNVTVGAGRESLVLDLHDLERDDRAIENDENEIVFTLDTSTFDPDLLKQQYPLEVAFSTHAILKSASVELDEGLCARDSKTHVQESQRRCWYPISC